MRIVGLGLIGLGACLLTVAVLGHITKLGNYDSAPARAWEKFNPSLAEEIRDWSALRAAAHSRIPANAMMIPVGAEVMIPLYELVTERFTHEAAQHTFWSNWLLAGMGWVHPDFAHIRNPKMMVKRGHSLLCDQSSYLLLRLAQEQGIRSRHVGLDGHVVMEAWYDDEWHMFDPDLEVAPKDNSGRVLSVDELAREPERLKAYYGSHDAIKIIASRDNNTYMTYPPGAWFEWKTNVLFWFEKAAEFAKFIVPSCFISLGMYFHWRVFRGTGFGNRGDD